MASARRQLVKAHVRLAAHAEFCRGLDRTRAAGIVELPRARAASRPAHADDRPAEVIDFVQRAQRHATERSRTGVRTPMLRELLWDYGEQRARPFVEHAVAMLSASEDPELRAEADGMREWLARRPF